MLTQRLSIIVIGVVVAACPGPRPSQPRPTATVRRVDYFPPIPAPNEFDTTTERSDFRRLIIGTCPGHCRPGPRAWIQPRVSAWSWSEQHRDSGQVIARLISDNAYPKFNLHSRGAGQADTVFWAVIKRGNDIISIFRSTTPGTGDLLSRTHVIQHAQGFFGGASWARWLWSDTDDLAWGTCDGGACCRSAGSVEAFQ